MSTHAPHPPIPAEALAKQNQLRAALRAMEAKGSSLEPSCLLSLRAAISGDSSAGLDTWIKAIVAEDLTEEACELLRASRREGGNTALRESLLARLGPLAAKAQQQRSARWQLDTRRTLIRFSYAKESCALDFDDGDLHAIFLQAFRLEGLRLVLDLSKRPRPLLTAGLPLPAGVGGRAESMDAVLKREPVEEPPDLMMRLNRRLPEGVCIHQWMHLPGYASPLGDLACMSHWCWEVPLELRALAQHRVTSFLETDQWLWDRGASKPDGSLDLRLVVEELCWEGDLLRIATRMGAYSAINPLKLLGAMLGIETARITGVVRTSVALGPDPRLGQADRFQPKLKNMYEDAVLLEGGSNIVLVDEEDDDPIQLGG